MSTLGDGTQTSQTPPRLPPRSLFDLPSNFFELCSFLSDRREITTLSVPSSSESSAIGVEGIEDKVKKDERWTCNICKNDFDSLLVQRSHFKSDLHRLNVKLNMAGKKTIKEEEFDEVGDDCLFEDGDISSLSGSNDESENELKSDKAAVAREKEVFRKKIHILINSGDIVSIWKCLLLKESEVLSCENNPSSKENDSLCVADDELINRLKCLISEPRDKTNLRIVLLASGGHFAGCVFDGNAVVAHKTFHRYVVRAKSGKRQSAQDATGKAANSAGSSLRRYNEAALKKEIQDLFDSWKSYFAVASCIWVYAPSKNYQLFFGGQNSILNLHKSAIRNLPLTVRRPTLKEAKRIFSNLTRLTYTIHEEESIATKESALAVDKRSASKESIKSISNKLKISKEHPSVSCSDIENSGTSFLEVVEDTALHEAAKSGDVQRTLELLEEGSDPCAQDSRGRTPYMLAKEKEVRNTFRRFMALNMDRWDWHAAKVPSALTKEMEESQTAKQTEKDAKRKAKAKELKKLRKAKEKEKAAALNQASASAQPPKVLGKATGKNHIRFNRVPILSKEEEHKRLLTEEREKRAAAAERRLAALAINRETTTVTSSTNPTKTHPSSSSSEGSDNNCSCCNSSLEGKVPFHRYNYRYCSSTCMHVHREILEDS